MGDMMKAKDLNGKDILDANGNKVGEVDDIEIDPMTKMVTSVIAKEGGLMGGDKKTIPVETIDVIGDNILLKRV